MKLSTLFPAFLLSSILCGQTAQPARIPTFHVQGTVTDSSGAVIPAAKVTFQTGQAITPLDTNAKGVYEADLPLGDYTMSAEMKGFRTYRRPRFRVVAAVSLSFDVTLPVAGTCDIQIVGESGHQVTQAEWNEAVQELCTRDEFVPVSSKEGSGFELYVRYGKRTRRSEGASEYSRGEMIYQDPVFVAYNLFSLQADRVVYFPKTQTLEASGNVVAEDQSARRTSAWMSYRIDDGQATPVH